MSNNGSWFLSGIHHIGLTVSDIERSIEFYRDSLGMELIGRRPSVTADYVAKQTGFPEVELNVASLRISGASHQTIELVQYMSHGGEPHVPATNSAGTSHLCLVVNDLRSSFDDLQTSGVLFKSDPVTITAGPNKGGLVAYFFDPDGYVLELFQPAKKDN